MLLGGFDYPKLAVFILNYGNLAVCLFWVVGVPT